MDEIEKVKGLEGVDLNKAKTILAYEATKICHGEDEAVKSMKAAATMFGSIEVPSDPASISFNSKGGSLLQVRMSPVPSTGYKAADVVDVMPVVDLFTETGLCKSKSDARRLIKQGWGIYQW